MFLIVSADNLIFLPDDACKENIVSPRLSSFENYSLQLPVKYYRSMERYNLI